MSPRRQLTSFKEGGGLTAPADAQLFLLLNDNLGSERACSQAQQLLSASAAAVSLAASTLLRNKAEIMSPFTANTNLERVALFSPQRKETI